MKGNNNQRALNQTEATMSHLYVFLLFAIPTLICCVLIALFTSDMNTANRKEQAIYKMQNVRNFRDVQTQASRNIDSLHNKIDRFNPGVFAQYDETSIKLMLNEIRNIYDSNVQDKRYQMFLQVANMYEMWFVDKKILWSKSQNIDKFQKDIQECEIGLQRMQEQEQSQAASIPTNL
jgi:hypothetical protein